MTQAPVDALSVVTVESNTKSFLRHLRAERKSANTIDTYRHSVEQFCEFLKARGMPRTMSGVRREHIEEWIIDLLERRSDSTANNRFRGLQQFWRWAVDEGEVKRSPMERMNPPKVDEHSVPVLKEDQLSALIRACSGTSFMERRDLALLMTFISSGARKSEVSNLRWNDLDEEESDVDLDRNLVTIHGKGGLQHRVDITPRCVRAIDRYVRARGAHKDADLPWLWLGRRGRLSGNGCARALQRRANAVGIGKINVHQLRHSYAHYWLLDGGGEDALMRNMGWKTRQMLSRYANSAGEERARAANRRVGLGRRF